MANKPEPDYLKFELIHIILLYLYSIFIGTIHLLL